jgi:3-isopropylmalate/(R)-2-methylmalate dehydratase small subunit
MSAGFRTLTGIAAPLPHANVDTDMILPAAFMKTVSREGLGRGLFHARRFDPDGRERPGFILNRDPWRGASILIALDNFGCGSSREHAPWALRDFGITCVIAPSFADIFHANCFKNFMLPIALPRPEIDRLMALAAAPETATLVIDLERQTIATAAGAIGFEIDPGRRARLLGGIDDIAHSLRFAEAIARHEAEARAATPWLADPRLPPAGAPGLH